MACRRTATTREEAIQLLGPRFGFYTYPLVQERNGQALVYFYHQTSGSAFNLRFYQQVLVLPFDARGVVTDAILTTSGQR